MPSPPTLQLANTGTEMAVVKAERVREPAASAAEEHLEEIVERVRQHRGRVARVLDCLDDLHDIIEGHQECGPHHDCTDTVTLLAQFSARLRRGDDQIRRLLADIDERGRSRA
jgi:hypothetical protein